VIGDAQVSEMMESLPLRLVTDPGARADGLVQLASQLPEADRREAYIEAIMAATEIADPNRQVRALMSIGLRMRPPGADTILATPSMSPTASPTRTNKSKQLSS
jgi:hypothetical protein